MKSYFFDKTVWAFHRKVVVLTEDEFANNAPTTFGVPHRWFRIKADSLENAKAVANEVFSLD